MGLDTEAAPERAATRARAGVVVASVILLPPLMGVLALALTMLTRMLVEREISPDLHLPTFWVWFTLCMAGIAAPIVLAEIRGPQPRGPRRGTVPRDARIWLTFLEEEAGPVTRMSLQRPEDQESLSTLVRASELESSDVLLLAEVTDSGTGLAAADGDSYELTPVGIARWASSTGTLRSVLDELLAGIGQRTPGVRVEQDVEQDPDLQARRAAARETVLVDADPTIIVPVGSLGRRLRAVRTALWVLYALVIVLVLGWRALGDAGVVADLDDSGWAMDLGGAAVLAGPFVIWGWYGLVGWVRAHQARHLRREVAARARADFWFFGLCSALVMVFLGGLATMALWAMDEGLGPPLAGAVVTAGCAGLAWLSHGRWDTARRVPRSPSR